MKIPCSAPMDRMPLLIGRRTLLWVVCIACLAGCSSPETPKVKISEERIEDVYARIDKAVNDPVRAKSMRNVVAELDRQLKAREASLNAKREAIIEANADYATTRQDLEALYAEVSTEVREMMGEIKAAHFALKELASPEEWETIAGGKKRLFGFN